MMNIYLWTKKFLDYAAAHERKEWRTDGHGELIDKTVGIIGLGNSGAGPCAQVQSGPYEGPRPAPNGHTVRERRRDVHP